MAPHEHAPRRRWASPAVLVAFILLAVVLTYPVAWKLDAALAGDGADSNLFIWNHWWLQQALLDGANPYDVDVIFWPAGTSLVLHTFSPMNGLAALALSPFVGLVASYNVLVILSFALAAWGAYLLAREITGSESAGIVAGAAFGFTPYHYAHALGHLNLIAYHWLPLFAYFLVRWQRDLRRRDLVGCVVMLVGAVLTDYALALTLGLFAVVFTLAWRGWRDRRALWRTVLPGLLAAVVVSPLAFLLLRAYAASPDLRDFSVESGRYSVDALSYLVPTPFSTLYGDFGRVLPEGGTTTEATVFLGYALVLLAAYAVVTGGWRAARAWLVTIAVFYVLSLGPHLQIAGRQTGVPLPYALFSWIPLLDTLRTPARFGLVVALGVSMLAALGVARIIARMPGRAIAPRLAVVAVLVTLVLAESVVVPFPTTEFRVSPIYAEVRATGAVALVELPLHQPGYAGQFGRVNYLAAQTVHGMPMVNGYHARETSRDGQFLRGELVLSALTRLELGGEPPEGPDVFPEQSTLPLASHLLAARGLTALVFHFSEPPTETETREWAFLQGLDGLDVAVQEPRATLLVVAPVDDPPRLLLDLGTGWHGLESVAGVPTRWAFQESEVYLDVQEGGSANVSMRLAPFLLSTQTERHFTFALDGREVHRETLGGGSTNVSFEVDLAAGHHVLTLRSDERAVSLSRYMSGGDSRPLAVAVQDVRVTWT